MTRRDALGQMSHSDLISLVLEQERIFEEAAQEWAKEMRENDRYDDDAGPRPGDNTVLGV